MLNVTDWSQFWVTLEEGTVQVGLGEEPGKGEVLMGAQVAGGDHQVDVYASTRGEEATQWMFCHEPLGGMDVLP